MIPAAPAGIWHDCECGAYADDLELWEELAAAGPVLELGCGTGRVLVHLARRGHQVTGIDSDSELVEIANARLRAAGGSARASVGDAREIDLGERFAVILATMQFAQLFHGAKERARLLDRIRLHLARGGRAAFALVGETSEIGPRGTQYLEAVPDVRERDGWLYSSLPLSVYRTRELLVLERLRQTVAADGGFSEARHTERLDLLAPAELEAEAKAAGLRPLERRSIPPSEMYSGTEVVIVEANHDPGLPDASPGGSAPTS